MFNDITGSLSFLDEKALKDPEKKLMADSTFPFNRAKTVSFSGHRPENLPDDDRVIKVIKSVITLEIESAVSEGFDTFITGGARGIDLWAALAVIEQKKKEPGLKLIAALPYSGSPSRYSETERFEYGYFLKECAEVLCATSEYSKDSMKKRNAFMVNNCSRLIAFIKNYRSGTGQTINLAKAAGVDTHVHKIDELF
jgi:uncharacterized phage-like protein YoqJ